MSYKVCLQHSEVLGHIVIKTQNLVSIAESHFVCEIIYIYTVAFVLDIAFAPCRQYRDVDNNRKDKVEQDASGHDEKSLPRRL